MRLPTEHLLFGMRLNATTYESGDRLHLGAAGALATNIVIDSGNPEATGVIGDTVTREEADRMLRRTVDVFAEKLRALITVPVSDNQFSACLLLAYNIGLGAFADSTALKRLNAGDPESPAEAMAWWNKACVNGKLTVLPGLARRRAEEIALFRRPDAAEPAPGDGTAGFDTDDTAQEDQDMDTTDLPPLAFWKARSFWLVLLSLGSAAGAVFGMPEIGQLAGAAHDAVEGGMTPEEAAALVSAAALVFARLERIAPARRLALRG